MALQMDFLLLIYEDRGITFSVVIFYLIFSLILAKQKNSAFSERTCYAHVGTPNQQVVKHMIKRTPFIRLLGCKKGHVNLVLQKVYRDCCFRQVTVALKMVYVG